MKSKERDWCRVVVLSASFGLMACSDDGLTAVSTSSGSTSSSSSSGGLGQTTVVPDGTTSNGTSIETSAADSTGNGSSSGGRGSSSSGSSSGSDSGTSSDSGSDSGTTTDGGSSSSDGGSSSSGGGMPFMCPPGGGMACVSDADCGGGDQCYVVGVLGGVCSECNEDADCAWGCSPGNPLSGNCATCCDGSLGCGCETDAACLAGSFCTQLLDVPGIIDVSTCSECVVDGDCMGGELCSPDYDLLLFQGQHSCVPPGSKANDTGCSADAQCTSGNCAPAALMGIPVLSVCSVCNEDADCPGASTCSLPELVIGGGGALMVSSGVCV